VNAAAISIALLLASLAPLAAAADHVVTGTYVRAGSNSKSSAILKVHEFSATQATISLDVIAKPSASATMARTGTLEQEIVQVSSHVAEYRDTSSGTGGCLIRFAFAKAYIQVRQTGQCDQFGVGIDATGRYFLRKAKSTPP
jgi:hypothetical protein